MDIALPGVDTKTWMCMKEEAGLDWAVISAFHSFGAFDNTSLVNLETAQKADIEMTDVYMFPCRGKDPNVQVAALTRGLANATFGTVWIDVEENPSTGCSWKSEGIDASGLAQGNCQFLDSLITGLKNAGLRVGIYSSHYEWNQTVGLSCTVANSIPLWYSHYDKTMDCTDYEKLPFGGWDTFAPKQFDDNLKSNQALSKCVDGQVPADIDVLCQ